MQPQISTILAGNDRPRPLSGTKGLLAERFRELLGCFEEAYASRAFTIGDALLKRAAKWILRRRTRFVLWAPEKVAMLNESFRAWESRAGRDSAAPAAGAAPMAGSGLVSIARESDRTPEPDAALEIAQLTRWIASLIQSSEELLASPQWRVGSRIVPGTARAMEGKIQSLMTVVAEELEGNVIDLGAPESAMAYGDEQPSQQRDDLAPKSRSRLSVDVIVCIHGALPYVQRCLDSVLADDRYPFRLLLMDDGSEDTTSSWLRSVAEDHENVILHREARRTGYTRTANRALRLSTADLLILLNSDTIVPAGWIEKLIECGASDDRIGIFGPLTNIGGWQTLPIRRTIKTVGSIIRFRSRPAFRRSTGAWSGFPRKLFLA